MVAVAVAFIGATLVGIATLLLLTMTDLTLGLAGVGRIGQLHARTLAGLARDLGATGTRLRLVLTDVTLMARGSEAAVARIHDSRAAADSY